MTPPPHAERRHKNDAAAPHAKGAADIRRPEIVALVISTFSLGTFRS
jgi:hypothetical protein